MESQISLSKTKEFLFTEPNSIRILSNDIGSSIVTKDRFYVQFYKDKKRYEHVITVESLMKLIEAK